MWSDCLGISAKVWKIKMQFISRNILLEQCLPPSPLPFYNRLCSSLPGTTSSAIELMDFHPLFLYCSSCQSDKVASLFWWVPNCWCGLQGTNWVCFCLSLQPWHRASPLLCGLQSHSLSFIHGPDACAVLSAWKKFSPYSSNYSYFPYLSSVISSYYPFFTLLGSQKHLFNERGSGVSIKMC